MASSMPTDATETTVTSLGLGDKSQATPSPHLQVLNTLTALEHLSGASLNDALKVVFEAAEEALAMDNGRQQAAVNPEMVSLPASQALLHGAQTTALPLLSQLQNSGKLCSPTAIMETPRSEAAQPPPSAQILMQNRQLQPPLRQHSFNAAPVATRPDDLHPQPVTYISGQPSASKQQPFTDGQ